MLNVCLCRIGTGSMEANRWKSVYRGAPKMADVIAMKKGTLRWDYSLSLILHMFWYPRGHYSVDFCFDRRTLVVDSTSNRIGAHIPKLWSVTKQRKRVRIK